METEYQKSVLMHRSASRDQLHYFPLSLLSHPEDIFSLSNLKHLDNAKIMCLLLHYVVSDYYIQGNCRCIFLVNEQFIILSRLKNCTSNSNRPY